MANSVKYRVGKSRAFQALIVALAFFITLPLLGIILYIFNTFLYAFCKLAIWIILN